MPQVQTTTTEGLNTTTINIQNTDVYNIQGTLILAPDVGSVTYGPGGGAGTGTGAAPQLPSQVVTTIRQNGSTKYTSNPGDKGFCLIALPCTAGDVITITLTSSTPADQRINRDRLTVAVSQGPL